jgi:succinyl-CoA synthetase alpha subunit
MIDPRIDRNTPVIVQGASGRAGRLHSRLMREYGTRIVGGISPRMDKPEIDGMRLFPDCRAAVEATGAVAGVALVGAMQLLDAMREAIAAGIRYIVTPTEGAPVHDMLKAQRLAREAGVVWVGPSTPGMAVPGEAKLGFLPTTRPPRQPHHVETGTLSQEGIRSRRGIGQSVWIGVGGDPVKGTRFADLVPYFAADAGTEALLIIGEIGGHEEEDFAAALSAHGFVKPVFALIAGRSAPEGITMGHAGALTHGSHGTYATKRAALEASGVEVCASLNELVEKVCRQFA